MSDVIQNPKPLIVSASLKANIKKDVGEPPHNATGNWFDLDKPLKLIFRAPFDSNFWMIAAECCEHGIIPRPKEADKEDKAITELAFSDFLSLKRFLKGLTDRGVDFSADTSIGKLQVYAGRICQLRDTALEAEHGVSMY